MTKLNEMKQEYQIGKLAQLTGFNFNDFTPAEPSPREKLEEKLAGLANIKVNYLKTILKAKQEEFDRIQKEIKENESKGQPTIALTKSGTIRKLTQQDDSLTSNSNSTEAHEQQKSSSADIKDSFGSDDRKLEIDQSSFQQPKSDSDVHFHYDKNVLNISLGKQNNRMTKHYSIG